MARRFITRQDIDELADAGRKTLEVDASTTVTDVAREHARERGVRIVATGQGGPAPEAPGGSQPDVRTAVRAAVVAHLREEPPELDAVIDRVLGVG